jgi:hypothetical protein
VGGQLALARTRAVGHERVVAVGRGRETVGIMRVWVRFRWLCYVQETVPFCHGTVIGCTGAA